MPGRRAPRPLRRPRRPDSRERIQAVLGLLPQYFSPAFVNRDGPDATAGTAVIPFGIQVMPFDEQKELIDRSAPRSTRRGPTTTRRPGSRPRSSGCRCSRPTRTRRCRRTATWLTLAGLARRRARPARRLPLAAAGARAADPDRARDRLVGARPGDRRGPAQPDVGDARRAGDRDRDRVQRPARRPLRRGARRRASRSARRCGAPTRAPGRRCSPPGSPRSPASRCSLLPTSGCCATSASSRCSTSAVALLGVLLVLPAALVWAETRLAPREASSPASRPLARGRALLRGGRS